MRCALVLLISLFFLSDSADARSARGRITQKVVKALSIENVSVLDFGVASAGAPAKTVPPSRSENLENGSFLVRGEPHASYSIVLPGDGDVVLRTRGGFSKKRRIKVSQFESYPSSRGRLNHRGKQYIYIGATRAALRDDQKSGDYKASYVVTVVY